MAMCPIGWAWCLRAGFILTILDRAKFLGRDMGRFGRLLLAGTWKQRVCGGYGRHLPHPRAIGFETMKRDEREKGEKGKRGSPFLAVTKLDGADDDRVTCIGPRTIDSCHRRNSCGGMGRAACRGAACAVPR